MTENESLLMDLVPKLLQELQEFVDDANDDGNDKVTYLSGTKALIEEGEQVMQQVSPWQNDLTNSGNDDLVLPVFLNE